MFFFTHSPALQPGQTLSNINIYCPVDEFVEEVCGDIPVPSRGAIYLTLPERE
jgi:hypothetical protein